MRVSQVMTQDVKACRPGDSLHTAARIMWENDCGCVPVVDERSRAVGMITDRDICMAAYFQERPLRDLLVSGTMNKNVCACRTDDSLEDSEKIMRINQVRRLPVIDSGGRLVGIISLNDVAREAVRQREQRTREVTEGEVAETLAAVCQPHVKQRKEALATGR